jgi:hypothetical protein
MRFSPPPPQTKARLSKSRVERLSDEFCDKPRISEQNISYQISNKKVSYFSTHIFLRYNFRYDCAYFRRTTRNVALLLSLPFFILPFLLRKYLLQFAKFIPQLIFKLALVDFKTSYRQKTKPFPHTHTHTHTHTLM